MVSLAAKKREDKDNKAEKNRLASGPISPQVGAGRPGTGCRGAGGRVKQVAPGANPARARNLGRGGQKQ